MFVTGHHADLYALPANFDVHIAGIHVTLDNVGVPTTDGRRLAEATHPHKHKSDPRHCASSAKGQWLVSIGVSELAVFTAVQIPLDHSPVINRLPGLRITHKVQDGSAAAWHFGRQFTRNEAKLARLTGSIPSVVGPANATERIVYQSLRLSSNKAPHEMSTR